MSGYADEMVTRPGPAGSPTQVSPRGAPPPANLDAESPPTQVRSPRQEAPPAAAPADTTPQQPRQQAVIDVPDDVNPLDDDEPSDLTQEVQREVGEREVSIELEGMSAGSRQSTAQPGGTPMSPSISSPAPVPKRESAQPARGGAPSATPSQTRFASSSTAPLRAEASLTTHPAGITDKPNEAGAHHSAIPIAVPDWIRLHPLLGAYLAEIIGTFIYVLSIALVEINNPVMLDGGKKRLETNIAPLPIGFMLTAMVFTFGYISGGHFNPAVSWAVFLSRHKEFGIARALGYIICQCAAALGAGIVAMIVQGSNDIIVPDVNNDSEFIRKGLFAELVFTFALATTVLNVAYSHQRKNFFYGFAIGMVVLAGMSSVGGVTGGAFNPAMATGLQAAVCLVGRCKPLWHFWMYWLSPFVGATAAALLFSAQYVPETPVATS